jgi:LysM repeat protein/predicted esterase
VRSCRPITCRTSFGPSFNPTMRTVPPALRSLVPIFALLLSATHATVSFAEAEPRSHRVQKGQTLSAIAHRYDVTVDAICTANEIRRRDPIRAGQLLIIPSNGDEDRVAATETGRETAMTAGRQVLHVPGAAPAHYYEPLGMGLRPVILVLHDRGEDPSSICQRWAPIARSHGWLVCPSGQYARGSGRTWGHDWGSGRLIVNATLQALRTRYGRRVQLYGNTLVGFGEGAFVAMNVGVREARAFNRWLILGADDSFWGPSAPDLLARAKGRMLRVRLITGENDSVHDGTMTTDALLCRAKIPVRVSYPADMGHIVALESEPSMYRAALTWLTR